MPLRLKNPPPETPTRSDDWARGPMPAPESRPHYYVRQGLWRLRGARRVAPWLLLAVPAAAIAVAAFEGKTIWHDTVHRHAKPSAEHSQQAKLKPRSSSRVSRNGATGSSGVAASSSRSSASGAQSASLTASPLVARIHSLRAQIAAVVKGGVTTAERAKLWRLRLRLAIAYRRLIRDQLAGNLSAAERARLDALLAKLDKRISILKKINRIFRGGVTASERAKLDSLVKQFLNVKAQAPLPTLSSLSVGVRATAAASSPASSAAPTKGAVTHGATTSAPGVSATSSGSPGNSAFGHSHKKPKKPKKH